MNKNLEQKLKTLPSDPGVYVMLDENNEIIYIGKAKVLKNRVRQYFRSPKNLTDKVIAMVNKINDLYYYIVNSESDALVLESNLIKKYKPQYNILLKDDKNYPYIRIDKKSDYPTVEITRKIKKDGAAYFGPYMGGVPVKDLIGVIYEGFHVRSCNINLNKLPKSFRPCLEYQTGRCVGPCTESVSKEEYRELIEKVVRFLKGDTKEVETLLSEKMRIAAEEERFERAIAMRNMLTVVEKIKAKTLSAFPKDVDMDVFGYSTNGTSRVINHLMIRQGRMQGGENYTVVDFVSTEEELLSGFVVQYYQNAKIPDEIVLSIPDDMASSVKEALSPLADKAFNVISPKNGVRKSLVELSEKNAADFMEKSVDTEKRKSDMTVGACERLRDILGLKKLRRMECYDISNVQGVDKVASMVVFFDGEKKSSDYRRFKIKTVEGANDFASMKEVLKRRLQRLKDGDSDPSFGSAPDLIVIDGGKGQLGYAQEAMQEVGIYVPMISLAKREEEVFVPGREDPIIIPKRDVSLKLLQRIRDESHRFAITFFRSLHNKNSLRSRLDEIEGIGEKKKQALCDRFRTVAKIKEASVKELAKTDGIGKKLAKNIYDHFHKGEADMKYKLVLSDYDDTLLPKGGKVTDYTLKVIHEYVKRGGTFVVSSGRSSDAVKKLLDENGINFGYALAYNGAYVADLKNDKIIKEIAMSNADAIEVIREMEKDGIRPQTYYGADVFTEKENEFTDAYIKNTGIPIVFTRKPLSEFLEEKGWNVPKVVCYVPDGSDNDAICEKYNKMFGDKCHFMFSKKWLFECVSVNAGKDKGAEALCEYLGLTRDDVMAFGDGQNDLSMIRYAGFGVAVKNACKELLEEADYIAPSDVEDGVAKTIEKFCLEG